MIWAYLIHLGQNFWREKDGEVSVLGKWSDTMVTEDAAWKEIVDYLPQNGVNTLIIDLGEGVKYESHPELACEGAWSKEKLKKELDRLRSMGMNPIPKLNFSTCHDAWLKEYSHMVSTPTYYKVAADLIDEACELFDTPDLLHVGMDEEWFELINFQAKSGYTCMRRGELFWHDIDYFFECVEKNHVRPWIWGDMHNFMAEETVKNLSKDAIVSAAMYTRMNDPEHMTAWEHSYYDAFESFAKHGFEQVPTCATYYNTQNAGDAVRAFKNLDGFKGLMTAPWFRTRETDVLKHKAEAQIFGDAIKRFF